MRALVLNDIYQLKGRLYPPVKRIGHGDNQWDENYKKLCSFKEETGHCCVPYSHPVLGLWVKKQKVVYEHLLGKRAMYGTAEDKDGKESSLAEERIRKLSEIGAFIYSLSPQKNQTL